MNMILNSAHAAACFIEYRLTMIPKALSNRRCELAPRRATA